MRKYQNVVKAGALISLLVGFAVIIGWIYNIAVFKQVIDGFPPMKFNTALCFILCGLSMFMIINDSPTNRVNSRVFSILILVFGIISLAEDLFHFNSGLDTLFFSDPHLTATGQRMATLTSICFTLIGIALLVVKSSSERWKLVVQHFLHFSSAIATIVIIGYAFRVPAHFKLFSLSSVALHTGILLFIVSASSSFINSEKGITGLFTGKEIGNQMARDIFPYLLALIIITGFLRLQVFRNFSGAIEFGIAIVTTSFILFSLLIIALTARQLNKINRHRLHAEEILRTKDLEVQDIKQQRSFHEQLAKEEERKKKEITDAIISAQERERYEISHELHDNVSQILTTCKLMLESAAKETENKFIQLSREHLQLAIDEIRNLSHQLNPATLTHIGLEGSVNDLVSAVNKTRKIKIDFRFDVNNIEQVKSEVQLALFRIIQEQVNNILKHSDAKKATVELTDADENIKLVIKDNGKGHDFTTQKHGLGLRNIFNRAEFHKGEARIISEPEKGFELQILIPGKN